MARDYTTEGSEMIDFIVLRAYPGKPQAGLVERVLEANSHLRIAELMPILPPGTTITLPDIAPDVAYTRVNTRRLWD